MLTSGEMASDAVASDEAPQLRSGEAVVALEPGLVAFVRVKNPDGRVEVGLCICVVVIHLGV